jgi:DNA-binding NtrC family response regulator
LGLIFWVNAWSEIVTKTIAIIDDEKEMEQLYSMLMEDAVQKKIIHLKFFDDSRIFLKWFEDNKPDLILSDINMPHMSGIELARELRTQGFKILTYFVSGDDESEYTDAMKKFGPCRFFSKPLDFEQVLNLIEEDLGLPHAL